MNPWLGFADSVFQGCLILSFLLQEHIAIPYVNLCTLFKFSPYTRSFTVSNSYRWDVPNNVIAELSTSLEV